MNQQIDLSQFSFDKNISELMKGCELVEGPTGEPIYHKYNISSLDELGTCFYKKQYNMITRKNGYSTPFLKKFRYGDFSFKNKPEYKLAPDKVGFTNTSFLYLLRSEDNEQRINAFVIELKNTQESERFLQYLQEEYGKKKIIRGPRALSESGGVKLGSQCYVWEDVDGKNIFIHMFYTGEGDNQRKTMTAVFMDHSNTKFKNFLIQEYE